MGFRKSYESLSVWMLLLLMMIVSSSAMDMSIISYDNQKTDHKPSSSRSEQEIRTIFEEWQVEHGKVYNTLDEKHQRFEVFKDNLRFIDKRNARNKSYELGLNEFSDLSFEEFSSKYLRSSGHESTWNSTAPGCSSENVREPVSIDWRTKGAVTAVKNQGNCGSCWSFGSVAAVEGLMKLSTQKIESLSEQEIIDCIKKDCSGPRGCSQDDAYGYIVNNGGITSSKNYPYVAAKRPCDNNKRKEKVFSITGFQQVGQSEMALKTAVARQPVSVDLKVHREFQSYKSGVYKGKCGSILDHVMTCVGYDTTAAPQNQAYWILKNSWGANWGEKGFMKLQRNVRSSEGKCGIVLFANYPKKKGFNDI